MANQDVKKKLAIAPKGFDADDALDAMRTAGPRVDTAKLRELAAASKTRTITMYVCSCGKEGTYEMCDTVRTYEKEVST